MRIGRFEVSPVFDGYGLLDARKLYVKPDSERDSWERHSDYLDEAGQLRIPTGGFLFTCPGRTILIDCGVGGIHNDRFEGGEFLQNLLSLGTSPDDVTDVFFTHLHFDHVGWATRHGRVTFPNATYHAHKADWELFVTGDGALEGARRKLLPVAKQLQLFDTQLEILDGFSARPVGGHTPGSTIFVVGDHQKRGLFLGDIVHAPPELLEPGWEASSDVDRTSARKCREQIAEEVIDDPRTWVVGAHFPDMKMGRVSSHKNGRVWQTV